MQNTKHYLIAFAAVIVISVAVYTLTLLSTKQTNTPPVITANTSAQKPIGKTFAHTLQYAVPDNGINTITTQITLDKDIVIAVQNTHLGKHKLSQQLQASFESEISNAVVGKKISDVKISRVGGASLTTKAFLNVLKEIQTQM